MALVSGGGAVALIFMLLPTLAFHQIAGVCWVL